MVVCSVDKDGATKERGATYGESAVATTSRTIGETYAASVRRVVMFGLFKSMPHRVWPELKRAARWRKRKRGERARDCEVAAIADEETASSDRLLCIVKERTVREKRQ